MSESRPFRFGSTFAERAAARKGEQFTAPERDEKQVRNEGDVEDKAIKASETKRATRKKS